jgi:hypothetical protein
MDIPHFFKSKLNAWVEHHIAEPIHVCCPIRYPFSIDNAWLLEAVRFEGQTYVAYVKRQNSKVDILGPTTKEDHSKYTLDDVTVSLITTTNQPYKDLLLKSINHYSKFLNKIVVAAYGDKIQLPNCDVRYYDGTFSMSEARNRSMLMVNTNFTLQIDTGMLLSKSDVLDFLYDGSSVINLKRNHNSGNGNYFGDTLCLTRNGYNEVFKGVWYEDTEYLMNFSRIGIIPKVKIVDLGEVPHKGQGNSVNNNNKAVFRRILLNGR